MATRRLRRSPSGSPVQFQDVPVVPSEWERNITIDTPSADVPVPDVSPVTVFDVDFPEPIPGPPVGGAELGVEVQASLTLSFGTNPPESVTLTAVLKRDAPASSPALPSYVVKNQAGDPIFPINDAGNGAMQEVTFLRDIFVPIAANESGAPLRGLRLKAVRVGPAIVSTTPPAVVVADSVSAKFRRLQ